VAVPATSLTITVVQLAIHVAPFPIDYLASVVTRCRYMMFMIALLFICRCDLWIRALVLAFAN